MVDGHIPVIESHCKMVPFGGAYTGNFPSGWQIAPQCWLEGKNGNFLVFWTEEFYRLRRTNLIIWALQVPFQVTNEPVRRTCYDQLLEVVSRFSCLHSQHGDIDRQLQDGCIYLNKEKLLVKYLIERLVRKKHSNERRFGLFKRPTYVLWLLCVT